MGENQLKDGGQLYFKLHFSAKNETISSLPFFFSNFRIPIFKSLFKTFSCLKKWRFERCREAALKLIEKALDASNRFCMKIPVSLNIFASEAWFSVLLKGIILKGQIKTFFDIFKGIFLKPNFKILLNFSLNLLSICTSGALFD